MTCPASIRTSRARAMSSRRRWRFRISAEKFWAGALKSCRETCKTKSMWVSLARRWYDEDGVSAIFGLGNSAVALAVQELSRQKNRIDVVTSAGTADLTGKACSPLGVHWTYDTYALAKGT